MSSNESFLHTPAALIHLFANSIQFDASREMKRVKGLYVQGKDVVYAGKYYDMLRDETGEASITFLVPALFREQLEDGQIIEVIGFLQKRIVAKGVRENGANFSRGGQRQGVNAALCDRHFQSHPQARRALDCAGRAERRRRF